MEELLNKLIEKGWKPFGWDDKLSHLHKEYGVGKWYIRFHDGMDSELFDLRQLTAKESGLWQFVCKNRFLKGPDSTDEWQKNPIGASFDELFYADSYQFYLIESALCDEDKLEKFLLDNIKVS